MKIFVDFDLYADVINFKDLPEDHYNQLVLKYTNQIENEFNVKVEFVDRYYMTFIRVESEDEEELKKFLIKYYCEEEDVKDYIEIYSE